MAGDFFPNSGLGEYCSYMIIEDVFFRKGDFINDFLNDEPYNDDLRKNTKTILIKAKEALFRLNLGFPYEVCDIFVKKGDRLEVEMPIFSLFIDEKILKDKDIVNIYSEHLNSEFSFFFDGVHDEKELKDLERNFIVPDEIEPRIESIENELKYIESILEKKKRDILESSDKEKMIWRGMKL